MHLYFVYFNILLKISIVYLGYYNDLKRWSDHGNTKDLKLHHTLFVIYIRKCKYKDHEKVKYELCQPFSPNMEAYFTRKDFNVNE